MSTDRIEVLRERNKYLLKQLRQQREKLERMSGCSLSRKRGREDEGVDEKEERRHPEDRSPARATLGQPSFRFADTEEMHIGPPSNSSSHSGTSRRRVPAVPTTLTDSHRNPQDYYTPADPRPLSIQSFGVMHNKLQEF
ncbi:hypothetical protein XENOCAPTIV_003742 [Xenoophorus captivus]|uniref:Uncharacterized protein n=1 Tax=Xenoophorus captivus TaxID=1517983 RepID=A0ABV0S6X9_9TELE